MTTTPSCKWQFARYGEKALILCQNCPNARPRVEQTCRHRDRWFGWEIPARIVKAWGSTMIFNAGCNYRRADSLKAVARVHRQKALPTYPKKARYGAQYHNCLEEPTIGILVDGELKLSLAGNYQRDAIKDALKPYIDEQKRIAEFNQESQAVCPHLCQRWQWAG